MPDSSHPSTRDGAVGTHAAVPDDLLQLWVDHGTRCTRIAIDLVSAWNAHHATAVKEHTHLMADSTSHPCRSAHAAALPSVADIPARIVITRDFAARNSLRALRAQKRKLIGTLEREAREQRLQQLQKHHQHLQKQQQQQAAVQAAAAALAAASAVREEERKREEDRRKAEERRREAERQLEQQREVARQQEAERQRAIEQQKSQQQKSSQQPAPQSQPFAQTSGTIAHQSDRVPAPPAIPEGDAKFQVQYRAWLKGPSLDWTPDPSDALKDGRKDLGLEENLRVLHVFDAVQQSAQRFRQDASVKRMRMAMKKTINRAVNQVSSTIRQVQSVILQLLSVFEQASVVQVPEAHPYAMHEIATRLVSESDTMVADNMEFAFSIGAILAGVMTGAPDTPTMKDVVLGAFYQHCVYTRPFFPVREKGEDMETFRTRVGYQKEEKEEEYSRRVRGCIYLLGAMFQTDVRMLRMDQLRNAQNPLALDRAWTWLVRIVNRRQRTMAPEVVYSFLETAGYALSQMYKGQFAKLVTVVHKSVFTHASPYASKLSLTNLEVWIEAFHKNGDRVTTVPQGRNLPIRDEVNS